MVDRTKDTLPHVSVIVPVYNAQQEISKLIEGLLGQSYPRELLEVIIVDNNSNDKTKDIIKAFSVKLLEENEIQSSYAARNKAIKIANGEILAFTDSDCIVTREWVHEGVKVLLSDKADMVGGKIEFIFSKKKTTPELYDSIRNMRNDLYIKTKKRSVTANLFVRSELFEKLGLFPEVKSGGDFIWTASATANGSKLSYAHKAIVKHPGRTLRQLLKKNFRVGYGTVPIWRQEGKAYRDMAQGFLRLLYPSSFLFIKEMVKKSGCADLKGRVLGVWFLSYLLKLAGASGIIFSILRPVKRRKGVQ